MTERQVRTVSIAFTDLVSSTAVFSRLGEDGAEALRGRHFSVLRRAVGLFGGREVKDLGDGLMVAFDSSTDAARCAVEMQRSICEDNRRRRSDPLAIRIGISTGEASAEEGDYFGRPVVEASRLCSEARPDEILTTEMVRLLVGGRADLTFENAGERVLKGLPRAIPLWRLAWEEREPRGVRVVLADDAVLVREGVARLLEEEGLEVVAQAGDADGLMRHVGEARPDIAITDVRMPPTSTLEGLEAAERIRRELPGMGVLVLSQHLEVSYALRLMAAGGAAGVGYLLKERVTDLAGFAGVVRRVAAGGSALDEEVVSELVALSRRVGRLPELSERDERLLRLLAQGLTVEETAEREEPAGEELGDAFARLFDRLGVDCRPDDRDRVDAVWSRLAAGTTLAAGR
jgi:class 3 adenylate cyclase/DNA-binding NarL/FixJ family response regulator